MNKKNVILLLLSVFMCGAIFANGQNESSESTGKSTVTIWHWDGAGIEKFYKPMAEKFEMANPDIDVEFVAVAQDQYGQSLALSITSGAGPDLFWYQPENDPRVLVDQNQVLPIDDYVDADFLSQFDQRLLVEGAMKYDGKLYSLPYENRFLKLHGMMFYNKAVLAKAGYSEDDIPKTFSELLEVATDISKKGNGEYYGIAMPGNPSADFHRILNGLLTTAAPASGDIRYGTVGFDEKSGKFKLDSEGHKMVAQLLIDLSKNGALAPGWASMKTTAARALFGQDQAAFYFGGTWIPRVVGGEYPSLDLGVAEAPVPDSGRKAYRYMSLYNGSVYMNANTKNAAASAKVFKWLHSKEFATAYFNEVGEFPGNQAAELTSATKLQKDFMQIAKDYVKTYPDPKVENPAVGLVAWPEVNPTRWDVFAGALIEEDINAFDKLAKQWNEKMQEALERNIEKANSEGDNVTLDDYKFPSWDYMSDY
ncbi:sugar ABC transporter substrate-binding protein [Thiospirochaeta perfilievii]|uniref:sn-glycerol-3-phosphate-binding periplasmic protein UgpB n=1 Tax=Thiospirochaeta perfilievii TaxID=252967 RepID=A0A5C1QC97_9SPIO|nr:sugar ABC transporter substrate-binding protein [Thiospirochaeta perfilievii]QEN04294.1 sugar ABC transporter substrate-binding protein [Thiospirochaeta perfilievii]